MAATSVINNWQRSARARCFLPITLYLVGWTLMTVAMMLPTMLPLLEIFRRLTMRRQKRSELIGPRDCRLSRCVDGILVVAAHMFDWVLHQVVERSLLA